MKKTVRIVIMVVSAAVFIYCAWKLTDYWLEYKHAKDYNEALSEMVVSTEIDEQDEKTLDKAPIKVDFETLLLGCPDIVGWLYCPDTEINYPVVQSEDNMFYLHRLTDGSYSENGTLFLDYRNASDFSDFSSIIYGHHMKSGAMFGKLDRYKEQEYYDEHPDMYLLTPDANYRLEICAGFNTEATSDAYDTERSMLERQLFIENAIGDSFFKTDRSVTVYDRYVLLSTCDYNYYDSRFVILAKLVPCE